jgi:hypothetical protein
MPSIWLLTDASKGTRRDVLGLYNWDSRPASIGYDAAKAGLDATKTYHAFDFWSRSQLPDFKGSFKFDVPAESCRIIAVRAAEGHPVLLSTSRHVTQGIIEVEDESWRDDTLSATTALVANDPCEMRVAGIADGKRKWRAGKVVLSAGDVAAGVTSGMEEASGLLRVTLKSPVSRKVRWAIQFE